MTLRGPGSRFLYASGTDLLGVDEQVKEFNPPAKTPKTQETTGPNSAKATHSPTGYVSAEDFEVVLWNNSTTQTFIDNYHATAINRAAQVVVWGFDTDVLGKKFTGCTGWAVKVAPNQPVEDLTEITLGYKVNGQLEVGDVILAKSTKVVDGDSEAASDDNGASTSLGGAVYLEVEALATGGATGLVCTMRDSTDNITFADLQAFTEITVDGDSAQRIAIASGTTIDRYVALKWVFTGTEDGSTTASIWAGIYRAT